MHKIVILGGAGDMARVAVRRLLELRDDVEITLADRDLERAREAAVELGAGRRVEALATDVLDPRRLRDTIRGASLVVNATGPYFRTGAPVLDAAIDERIHYIDFGDDLEAADVMLGLDRAARDAGITALIGAGVAPGVVNVAVRRMADTLDEVRSAQIAWVTGSTPRVPGRERGGRAVLEHMLHECTGVTCRVRGGRREPVAAFRHPEVLEFPEPLGRATVYDLGHAELATIPRAFPGIEEVRTQGGLVPVSLNGIFQGVAASVVAGNLEWEQAVDFLVEVDAGRSAGWAPTLAALRGVAGQVLRAELGPHDFVVLARMLAGADAPISAGGLYVRVEGTREGRPTVCLARSALLQTGDAGGMDDVTGTPMAVFASLLLDGHVKGPGVVSPEGALDPARFEASIARFAPPGLSRLFAPEVSDAAAAPRLAAR